MFQPARPPETWSSEEKRRARWKGSLKVVEAVAIRPMCVVATAIAGSTVSGSSPPETLPPARPPHSASPSAKKIESNLPRSAVCASCWK